MQRREEHAATRVERPAATDPDGRDLGAGRLERLSPEREQPPEPLLRPPRRLGRRDDETLDTSRSVDDPGGELRAADVEPEYRRGYPFLPWTAMPRMKYFWNAAKRMIIGRISRNVPAMITW